MGDEIEEVAGISVTCGGKQAAEKVKSSSSAKSFVSVQWYLHWLTVSIFDLDVMAVEVACSIDEYWIEDWPEYYTRNWPVDSWVLVGESVVSSKRKMFESSSARLVWEDTSLWLRESVHSITFIGISLLACLSVLTTLVVHHHELLDPGVHVIDDK